MVQQRIVVKAAGADVIYSVGDAARFKKIIDNTIVRMKNLAEPLGQFGEFIVTVHIPYQFSAQGAPDPWPNLSPRYAARKARKFPGRPLLVRTGRMVRGFGYQLNGETLSITNSEDYATYHQTGTRKMPARKYLQLKDNDLGYQKLRDLVREHVLSQDRFR